MKAIGALMLVASGLAWGASKTAKLYEKVRFLEDYAGFIKSSENEIRYTGRRVEEIVKGKSGKGAFYSCLALCSKYTSEGRAFPEAWAESFSRAVDDVGASREVYEAMTGFGAGLGASDVEGQLAHCGYHYELARKFSAEAAAERASKGKLYLTLGAGLGAAVALLLI